MSKSKKFSNSNDRLDKARYRDFKLAYQRNEHNHIENLADKSYRYNNSVHKELRNDFNNERIWKEKMIENGHLTYHKGFLVPGHNANKTRKQVEDEDYLRSLRMKREIQKELNPPPSCCNPPLSYCNDCYNKLRRKKFSKKKK